ncbi:ATP-binding protein [Streptomyces chartreusis]|uniref:ATP-binding protein n=1 Tax=Streptomyces chartreusis TaxID=1969 RepID=UPI0037F78BB4
MPAARNGSARLVRPSWLLGRAPEWERLERLYAEAASGHGVSVLLEGETGIGKTSLMRAYADACKQAGFLVLMADGDSLEQHVPFQLVRSCFESLGTTERHSRSADLADLFAMLGGQRAFDSADWEFAVTEAMCMVFDRWCAHGPVALFVDDLHQADDSSLVALSRLHRTLRQIPLLVCATLQPAPQTTGTTEVLQTLLGRWNHKVTLQSMDDGAIARMVEGMVGAEPGTALQEYVASAAGNPLFVTEMISGLMHTGSLALEDGVADVVTSQGTVSVPPVPGSIKTAVLERFADLPAQTKELIAVMAVMGPRVRLRDLSFVLGTTPLRLWKPVKEVVDTGLLEEAGESLAFKHALVKRVIVDSLPVSMRNALEARAGRRMIEAGTPEQALEFLSRTRLPMDKPTLAQLADAAPSMVQRAPSAAADVLRRALTETDPADANRAVLYRYAVTALLRSEEFAAAQTLARQALDATDTSGEELELHWSLIQSLYQQGLFRQAVVAAETALRTLGDDSRGRARLHCMVANCYFLQSAFEPAGKVAELAALVGEAEGDPYAAAFALTLLSVLSERDIRLADSLAQVDEALEMLVGQEADPNLPLAPHFVKGVVLTELERFDEAHSSFDQGLRECDRGGNFYLTWYHLGKAQLYYHDGRWDDGLAETGAGLETVDHARMFAALRGQAALIAVHRGELPDMALLTEQSPSGPANVYGYLHDWALALAHEAHGEPSKALDLLVTALEDRTSAVRRRFLLRTSPDLLRLAASLGDSDRIRMVCEELVGLVTESEFPGTEAELLFGRGLAEQDPAILTQAAARFHDRGWVLYEEYAQEAAAEAYALRGQMPAARSALKTALALCDQLGAVLDAKRAEKQLARQGVRLRRRARVVHRTGWEALTKTEHTIVQHVAEGCSNPEIGARMFLSPRTVQFHLSAIFTKLDLTSRVELAVGFRQKENGDGLDGECSAQRTAV